MHARVAVILAACSVLSACQSTPPTAFAPARLRPIVLVTIDTLRADHVTRELTPNIWSLGEEGIRFDRAVSVGSVTLPAHASLLTGLFPPRHGVRDNAIFALPAEIPSLTERLRTAGYATGAFVSSIVLDSRHGLSQGFDVYDDEVGETERPAEETLSRAEQWLSSQSAQPFFAWIHLFEPHAPYVSGSYRQEVAHADRALGRFFQFLRDRGLWRDLVVSVTSDHGEALGDHGEQTHGFYLYDSTIRIPWLVRVPGQRATVVPHQVRLVDVMPTLMELAQVEAKDLTESAARSANAPYRLEGRDASRRRPAPDSLDGVSLVHTVQTGDSPRLEAFAETWLPRHQFNWSELQALRTEDLKLIVAPSARSEDQSRAPELYDLGADGGEAINIASNRRTDVDRLHRTLGAVLDARRFATSSGTADPLVAERFMSLGYIGAAGATTSNTHGGLPLPSDKLPVYLHVMSALELASAGKPREALAKVNEALALDQNVAQAYFLRGTLLGQQGRFADAAVALERTLALSPRYAAARFKLALAHIRLGNGSKAEQELNTVVTDEPENARAWHNLAALAYTRRDLDRAETLERRALAIDPSYVEAWNTLGAISIVRGQHQQAIEALERALNAQPTNGQVWANLALALNGVGRSVDAVEAQQKACSFDQRYCGKSP